jgi:hypothetical protein
MAEDRSIKDIIRFLDPSGEISDAEIASISNSLKFSEVLDLISAVSDDKVDAGRNILSKHDPRFSVTHAPETQPEESITNEYSNVPLAPKTTGMFKPIAPQGTQRPSPTTTGQQGSDQEDLNALVNDPSKQNDPNVKQIQNLLQRLQNR